MTGESAVGHRSRPAHAQAAAFVVLTFLLTLPFVVVSAATRIELMPRLPLAALAVCAPPIAAIAIALITGGRLRDLWPRAEGSPGPLRAAVCWIAAGLAPVVVAVASFAALRASGSAIPDARIEPTQVLALAPMFLAAAALEEVGWTAFLLHRLRQAHSPLVAGLLVAAVWALWHYPALLQAGRSFGWIAWWTLGTFAMRVLMVGIFVGTGGSLISVVVFHAMTNLAWQLFPVSGSWFDPRTHGVLMAILALAAVPSLLKR